ncbi:MAG: zonular occludens toxin domain-containing protein [Nanoarchaeota archaeon]
MGIFDLFKKRKEKEIDFRVMKDISGNFDDFKNRLKNSSLIILITGKRGSGKTALGFKFLDVLAGKRSAYYLGEGELPRFIKKVSDVKDVKNDSILLVDEAAISYSSRNSMKKANKVLSDIMVIARHKNLSLIIITQNSAMIDLNVVRLTDTIIFKEPSLLQARFERKSIKDLFEKADKEFKKVKDDKKSYFYVLDDEFEGMLSCSLPDFWSDKLSKSFSKY